MPPSAEDIHFRPFTVLLGIILGCLFSIAFCTAIVCGVFWFLSGDEPRIAGELARLFEITWIFAVLTTLAALSFLGSLRNRGWRYAPLAALWAGLALMANYYWPG